MCEYSNEAKSTWSMRWSIHHVIDMLLIQTNKILPISETKILIDFHPTQHIVVVSWYDSNRQPLFVCRESKFGRLGGHFCETVTVSVHKTLPGPVTLCDFLMSFDSKCLLHVPRCVGCFISVLNFKMFGGTLVLSMYVVNLLVVTGFLLGVEDWLDALNFMFHPYTKDSTESPLNAIPANQLLDIFPVPVLLVK